jgi:LPXTG-motif cell wall-anchored protein
MAQLAHLSRANRRWLGTVLAILATLLLAVAAIAPSVAAPGTGQGDGPGTGDEGVDCDGSDNSDTGHGANQGGPYDNTCPQGPSQNGNQENVDSSGNGPPCAGCVGNADDKNPGAQKELHGQYPNGSDSNAGYECDRNQGVGQSNPAHTGCTTAAPTTTTAACPCPTTTTAAPTTTTEAACPCPTTTTAAPTTTTEAACPCPTTTTAAPTTTTEAACPCPTTTTAAPTTTTAAPTTTTEAPCPCPTTTTEAAQVLPTVVTRPPGDQGGPPGGEEGPNVLPRVSVAPEAQPAAQTLPFTGANPMPFVIVAGLMMTAGGGVLLTARRRSRT